MTPVPHASRYAFFAAVTAVVSACSAPTASVVHAVPARPAPSQPAALSAGQPFPAAENRLQGTSAWKVTHQGAPTAIEGYADHVSVLPGQSFRLFVSTVAARFRVESFRLGWYGGRQARLVWSSGSHRGRAQAAPRVSAAARTVTAPWHPSLVVATSGWPEGAYLLRLDASSGAQRYVTLTVRSASTAGKVVILEGVTTWEAYNLWGGYSLYDGPRGYGDRSYQVSFDRPYDLNGANKFLYFDQPAIAIAERSRVPLAYETDVDLDEHPGLLAGARAVISLGHDEYYSAAMRSALAGARDAGANIAFLGANAMYRHIRFGSSARGADRLVICYKDASIDPLLRVNNEETTQDWRDPPVPRPESVITGVFYECNPVSAPYVVYEPSSWIFAGTGARKGQSFPSLVGVEYDRVNPAVPFPQPMEVVAHSPLTCGGSASYADSAYYTVRSGAGVFAAGTMRWVCALLYHCGQGVTRAAQRFTDTVTTTLLRVFAAGPAGLTHPATDDLARIRPRRGNPYEGVPDNN